MLKVIKDLKVLRGLKGLKVQFKGLKVPKVHKEP